MGETSAASAFFTKLVALLRAEVGEDTFASLIPVARAHAGGVAKAERAKAEEAEGEPRQQSESVARSPFLTIFPESIELSDDPTSKTVRVQIFPKVGTYKHPEYGDLAITPQFFDDIVRNFDSGVYNQSLPLYVDAEHQSKLSGAMGYIKKLDRRGNDGIWADIELNDRGFTLVKDDAFRHYSPEYYDSWTDPASGETYNNVMIGGALTARPFFKGMQPIYLANERAYVFAEVGAATAPEDAVDHQESQDEPPNDAPPEQDGTSEENDMSIDPKEFAEVQSKLAALTERLAAEETARKAAETEAKEAKEAAANLRRESSRRELSELVVNHRFAFKGEIPEVVDRLERMRSVMSSEDWTAYVDGQKAIHAALSESELLKQHSTEGGDASQTPFEKLIAAKVQAGKSLSEATAETARQNPKLYEEHVRKHNRRVANPE